MKAHIGPLGTLERLPSKKTFFERKNGRVQTGFMGGPILSLPLLLLTISTLVVNTLNKVGVPIACFFKSAQVGGRTWDLFSVRLFSLTSSALDHSATVPPVTIACL